MTLTSNAATLREDLEARGEYVVRANANSGWFAVFESTWQQRIDEARRDGREGPNLVVYRTRTANPRDHYVVPYSVISNLLVTETITHSEVNGSKRWNLTLKDGKLHVSHRSGMVDVSQFHGARLLVEPDDLIARLLVEPEDTDLVAEEGRTLFRMHRLRERDPLLVRRKKRAVLAATGLLSCEVCTFDFAAVYGPLGEGFAECHHRIPLSELVGVARTRLADLAIVCANCHRMLHRRDSIKVEQLREVVQGRRVAQAEG